jgi:hypothetical protein
LAAVKSDALALKFASNELRGDRDVVLAAVESDGEALEYASKKLREDGGIVLAAVTSNGRALEYASKKLRSHPDIVAAAKIQQTEKAAYAYYAGGLTDRTKNTEDQLNYDTYAKALVNVVGTVEKSGGANFAVGL